MYGARMTILETLNAAAKTLQPEKITCAADKSLGRLEAEVLLAHVLKKDRAWLLGHARDVLRSTSNARFFRLVRRRQKHEPIAYILGKKEFYGRPFKVTKAVLIPRPETEHLIELALRTPFPQSLPLGKGEGQGVGVVIWDVGTGSGAVAVTLALELPNSHVIASDISPSAVKIAKQNAARLHASKRVHCITANLLDAHIKKMIKAASQTHQHLVVTANLPYLPLSDKKILDPDVTKYEPSSALFSGRNGLELITRFLDHLALALHEWKFKRVAIFVEFDPPQVKKLLKLAKSLFLHAEISFHKDLAGRDRVLKILPDNP